MNKEINQAVESFIKFIGYGWQTELAFDCCYDAVYDMIGAEDFLNLCQEAVKNHKITVTVSM